MTSSISNSNLPVFSNNAFNSKPNSNNCILIAVLCKTGIYACFLQNFGLEYNSLFRLLKTKSNWTPLLLDQSKHQKIFFDVTVEQGTNKPSSIAIVTDTMQLVTADFNLNKEEGKDLIINARIYNLLSEIKDSAYPLENLKLQELVGVGRKYGLVYVLFSKKVLLYNLERKMIINIWNIPTETIKEIYFVNSLIRINYYFIAIVTNRNLWYTIIDVNIEDFSYNKSFGPDFFTKGLKINYSDKFCVVCKEPTKKRCSSCKEAFYCSQEHQEKDWHEKHKYYCLGISNEEVENVDIIHVPKTWYSKRKGVVLHFKSCNAKNIKKGILMCCGILRQNRKLLNMVMKSIPTLFKNNPFKSNSFITTFSNYFNIIEDYTANNFLWAYGNILINDKQEALTIINKFYKELEEKIEFKKLLDITLEGIKFYSSKLEGSKNNIACLEEIFIRFMKLVTTLGKMFHYLGEFEFFITYIIEYTEKMERFCYIINSTLLISKTYYYLGNLFVELDKLNYSIILFNEAINELSKYQETKSELAEIDLMIALNFNLGLIYFVTDQFKNSIMRLEKALKLSKEVKGEVISDVTANIYEVLGEIHLEYKNYSDALVNLNTSLEIKYIIIQNCPLKKSTHEKSITKMLIMIDFINQMLIRDEEEEKTNVKLKRKQQTNEMANKLGLNLLKKTATNILKSNNKMKKLTNNNNQDLFDYVAGIQTHGKIHGLGGLDTVSQPITSTLPNQLTNFFGKTSTELNKNLAFKNTTTTNNLNITSNINNTHYNNTNNNPNDRTSNNYQHNKTVKNVENIKKKNINDIKKIRANFNQESRDEIERFFIFISKLNQKQIDLLNLGQTHMNYNIPITFSPDFKNELTNHQKLELANFNIILLNRSNLLKNPTGKFEESNLQYDVLYHDDYKNNITSIKNFFVTSKILKNWESTVVQNNNQTNNIQGVIKKQSIFGLNPIKIQDPNENMILDNRKSMINVVNSKYDKKSSVVVSSEMHLNNLEVKKELNNQNTLVDNLTPRSNISDPKKSKYLPSTLIRKGTKGHFNFDDFKNIVLGYIEANSYATDSVFSKINDAVLFKLSKTLTRDELDYLMKEPQLFYEFLDNQEILSSDESEVEVEDNKEKIVEEEKDDHEFEKQEEIIEEVDESFESTGMKKKNILDFDTMKKANI